MSEPMVDKEEAAPAPATGRLEPSELEEAGGEGPASVQGGRKRILVNVSDPEEVRIAVLEDGRLEEIHFERAAEKKHLGNIYKGRVVNLEPAIQAAFVDLGIGRNGFLHVSDVLPAYAGAAAIPFESLSQRPAGRKRFRIQEILAKGQEVLVQISKDSIGAKGPTLTSYVSIPGQYLVLMPGISRYGISKRIEDGEARAKLRELLARLDPPKGLGAIVRTAGRQRSTEELERDLKQLVQVWGEIGERVRSSAVPALIFEECDLMIRVLRDLLAADAEEILIDGEEAYRRSRDFLAGAHPELERRVRLYDGSVPLFTRYGVEEEIERIYNRKVPLPSGGYLVIEETEALVAIDVNSGRYRDEEDLEATALKINLEAAPEIARQLRLRDLGGVIVNDFIDM
ncbi:MAG: Rne/Rng family ribonuclease, partial [Thermoanaerobaculia bacterium]